MIRKYRANVTCPHCYGIFDLFYLFDIDVGRLIENIEMLRHIYPFAYAGEKLEDSKTTVKCPECGESVEISGIEMLKKMGIEYERT